MSRTKTWHSRIFSRLRAIVAIFRLGLFVLCLGLPAGCGRPARSDSQWPQVEVEQARGAGEASESPAAASKIHSELNANGDPNTKVGRGETFTCDQPTVREADTGVAQDSPIRVSTVADLVSLARAGDPDAQFHLGVRYYEGDGVQRSVIDAIRWLEMASEKRHARARYRLGVLYRDRDALPDDVEKAARLFRQAADQGLREAQNDLGTLYLEGKGVPQDSENAFRWFALSANQGLARAQNSLGLMYLDGVVTIKNASEAARLFRSAAAQGLPEAQVNLSRSLLTGNGVPQNTAEAMRCLQLAAEQGDPDAPGILVMLDLFEKLSVPSRPQTRSDK